LLFTSLTIPFVGSRGSSIDFEMRTWFDHIILGILGGINVVWLAMLLWLLREVVRRSAKTKEQES
jgi:hypothetical protein